MQPKEHTIFFICHRTIACVLLKRHRFRTVGDKSGLFVKIHFFVLNSVLFFIIDAPYL